MTALLLASVEAFGANLKEINQFFAAKAERDAQACETDLDSRSRAARAGHVFAATEALANLAVTPYQFRFEFWTHGVAVWRVYADGMAQIFLLSGPKEMPSFKQVFAQRLISLPTEIVSKVKGMTKVNFGVESGEWQMQNSAVEITVEGLSQAEMERAAQTLMREFSRP